MGIILSFCDDNGELIHEFAVPHTSAIPVTGDVITVDPHWEGLKIVNREFSYDDSEYIRRITFYCRVLEIRR